MKKGFTLIELVVAVAIFVILLTFAGLIFKVSLGSYRLAGANAEIMRNVRAITDQLNSDFAGFQKDGYLIIQSHYIKPDSNDLESDQIYYFSTGDFQSWFNTARQSNIARIYWSHDIFHGSVNQWPLARNVTLLTVDPNVVLDCNSTSFPEFKTANDPNILQNDPLTINTADTNGISQLMCENVGQFKIQWTDGTCLTNVDGTKQLIWFGLYPYQHRGNNLIEKFDDIAKIYKAYWTPSTDKGLLPRAIKFTFTLYDSRGIIKNGRTFTHIVYIDRF